MTSPGGPPRNIPRHVDWTSDPASQSRIYYPAKPDTLKGGWGTAVSAPPTRETAQTRLFSRFLSELREAALQPRPRFSVNAFRLSRRYTFTASKTTSAPPRPSAWHHCKSPHEANRHHR